MRGRWLVQELGKSLGERALARSNSYIQSKSVSENRKQRFSSARKAALRYRAKLEPNLNDFEKVIAVTFLPLHGAESSNLRPPHPIDIVEKELRRLETNVILKVMELNIFLSHSFRYANWGQIKTATFTRQIAT